MSAKMKISIDSDFMARVIQDNEKLLTVLIEYNFDFTIILQNKLVTLKELLQLAIDSVFYVLCHCQRSLIDYAMFRVLHDCQPSPTHEYQSVINLIQVIMCQLADKSIKLVSTGEQWKNKQRKENYKRYLEMEKENVDTSLIYGKKIGGSSFSPNVHNIPREIERVTNKITDCPSNLGDTSLGRQLYIWLYVIRQVISREPI